MTLFVLLATSFCMGQRSDSVSIKPPYKNIIRYNLSGAVLFGVDSYIVFGYERIVAPRQSFSVNFGRATLPKVISINVDSISISKNQKRNGFNFSADYRFYLAKENRYAPPHGLYIGPYYSFNRFTGETQWTYKKDQGNSFVTTNTEFNINTIGFEMGYQFVLWKRLALDILVVGPGFGFYNYNVKLDSNISAETKERLFSGLEQLLTQKFPGMNYVFSDSEINADGVMRTNTFGYRYIIHIGFVF